jgi:hypothetical protein
MKTVNKLEVELYTLATDSRKLLVFKKTLRPESYLHISIYSPPFSPGIRLTRQCYSTLEEYIIGYAQGLEKEFYPPILTTQPIITLEVKRYYPKERKTCLEPTKAYQPRNIYSITEIITPLLITINEKEVFIRNPPPPPYRSNYFVEDSKHNIPVLLIPGTSYSTELTEEKRSFIISCEKDGNPCFKDKKGRGVKFLLEIIKS